MRIWQIIYIIYLSIHHVDPVEATLASGSPHQLLGFLAPEHTGMEKVNVGRGTETLLHALADDPPWSIDPESPRSPVCAVWSQQRCLGCLALEETTRRAASLSQQLTHIECLATSCPTAGTQRRAIWRGRSFGSLVWAVYVLNISMLSFATR